jgi:hypothetical protein
MKLATIALAILVTGQMFIPALPAIIERLTQ